MTTRARGRARRAIVVLAAGLAPALACSGKTLPNGGLMLVMRTEGAIAPTRLHVEVTSLDGAKTYRSADYAIPAEATFPTSLAIASNGSGITSAKVSVSVWSGAVPLDLRQNQVFELPTDRVAELDVVFSAACSALVSAVNGEAVSKCAAGSTCDPSSGACVSGDVHAGTLPTFGGDLGASDGGAPSADAPAPLVDAPAQPDGAPPVDASTDAGPAPGTTSCSTDGPGVSDCGPTKESCCTTIAIPGGSFFQTYDAVTYTSKAHPATISPFKLDKYEVTIGRFRRFIAALESGYQPPSGSGKHAHLNNGGGLNGGTEQGWQALWSSTKLLSAPSDWDKALACEPHWTSTPGANESMPMSCVTWYEAYAFCIWDGGGFLPSEAEWNLVASGGADQRVYPWSSPPTSSTIDDTHAVYCGSSCTASQAVGSKANGFGKWGHADLAGNVYEWTLDMNTGSAAGTATAPCVDCYADSGVNRVLLGGSYDNTAPSLAASVRFSNGTDIRSTAEGIRCARVP